MKTTASLRPVSKTAVPRVLIVDDDQEFAALLSQSLEKDTGARVHCVTNAFDGMNELLDSYYDLVILDWNLCGVDGIQALKAVDKQMGFEDRVPLRNVQEKIPVVLLSAHDPELFQVSNREKKHFHIRRVLSKRHALDELVKMIGSGPWKQAV